MNKSIIRTAKVEDLIELKAMYLKMYDQLGLYGLPYRLNEETIEDVLNIQLKARTSKFFVAENEERLIGFVAVDVMKMDRKLLYDRDNIMGHVKDIYVDENIGRSGLGSMLLKEAEEWLKNSGATIIECNVMIDNEPAQKFWSKSQYQVMANIYFKKIG